MMTGEPKRGLQGFHLPGRTVRGHLSRRLSPVAHHRRPILKLQFKTNSRSVPISSLSGALFVRHYWGHPRWFLFLRLLICLNSAGIPVRYEVNEIGVEKTKNARKTRRDARSHRDFTSFRKVVSWACPKITLIGEIRRPKTSTYPKDSPRIGPTLERIEADQGFPGENIGD